MRRIAGILGVLLCLMLSVGAQDVAFPTVTALADADIPRRDRVQLARELLGVTDIPPPLTMPVEYQVGDRRSFYIRDTVESTMQPVEAELYALGDSITIWVDTRASLNRANAVALANEFDTAIYPKLRQLWGSERTPGIDGDPRIVALFSYDVSPGVAAYYISLHTLPRAVEPNSNEAEMIIFNLNAYGGALNGPDVYSLMTHEFQHMIRDNLATGAQTWLNEGMSIFTEWYMDYSSIGLAFAPAMFEPGTQLNAWNSTAADYGMAGLFVIYVYERFGLDGIAALSHAHGVDMALVDNALAAIGAETDAATLYADFAAAVWLQDPSADPRWGFPSVDSLIRPAVRRVNVGTFERVTPPYSLEYATLSTVPNGQTLTVTAAFDATARLLPTAPATGETMWAAIRQDDSAPTLTRAIDLRGVETATLHYRVWYALEAAYDYGFVTVSDDGGATWDVLSTPEMAGRSLYGAAYTGASDGWREQTISLDAYAGQEILVRFMVITDDALTDAGMAVDDIRLITADDASDDVLDDDGWDARGWIYTDNRLPAALWIQVLQRRPNGSDVQRVLSDGDEALRVFIHDDTTEVALAFSPVIPLTTETLSYAVTVSAE